MLPVWRAIGVLVCALSLSGCLTPPDFDTGPTIHSLYAPGAQTKQVWYVTTRCDEPMSVPEPNSDPRAPLLSKRCWDVAPRSGEIPNMKLGIANGADVHCGTVMVTVAGKGHDTESTVGAPQTVDCNALRGIVESNDNPCHCTLIFVHGFNTTLPYALKRMGQLALDLDHLGTKTGIPILFSFGASGRFHDYVNDIEAAEGAAPALQHLLASLSSDKVSLIAHSMGTRIALRAITEGEPVSIQQMIAAAPDVDPAAFLHLADRALPGRVKHLTVYTSEYDTAMAGSVYEHNGRDRVGHGLSVDVGNSIHNADVINASNAGTTGYGHSYFAESELVLGDIAAALNGVDISARPIDRANVKGPTIPCPANESCSPSVYEQFVKWITRLAF